MPKDLDDLINKIKANPKLIKHIVFNPEAIHGPGIGRDLPEGRVTAKAFLAYLADPRDGLAIGNCGSGTQWLVAKGTQVYVANSPGKKKGPRKGKRRRK